MADIPCPSDGALVESQIDKVLTQYRESPNLLGIIRSYLREVEQAYQAICAIPDYFDLETAVGDQLTLIGKRLGWPRCHCVCVVPPVFGFDCAGSGQSWYPIVGFCEDATWVDCNEVGAGEICLSDDAVYRRFLQARRYQMLGLYDVASLTQAIQYMWGQTASVTDSGGGDVVISPGRVLTSYETMIIPLAFRVLPVAPGIRPLIHYSSGGSVFGFGDGWGGFCEDAEWLCPSDPHIYDCA